MADYFSLSQSMEEWNDLILLFHPRLSLVPSSNPPDKAPE
jgi:hypothetical protein